MITTIPGTDILTGKWYPADLPPPKLPEELYNEYSLLLGIKSIGIRHGFYVHDEGKYYWHCERFDSFDFEEIPGWTFDQQVNANLDWVYEVARGVSAWMLIPDFDAEWPSVDGTSGHELDPDWSVKKEEEDDDDDDEYEGSSGSTFILPIHPN
ncbi:hypothetical protein GCM10028805_25820 [Spirosoma harenae]